MAIHLFTDHSARADVAERVSKLHPIWLKSYMLVDLAGKAQEHELIWHLAGMLPRLGIAEQECNEVAALLFGYLENESRIVKTCALQALFELAEEDDALRPKIQALIVELASKETGALRARLNSREVRM